MNNTGFPARTQNGPYNVPAAIGYAARDRLRKKLFNPGGSIEIQSMPEQMISRHKKEEEIGKGLTAEQRRHMEKKSERER